VGSFKKVLIIATLGACALGIAACGSSSSSTTSNGSASAAATSASSSAGSGVKNPGVHTIGVLPSTATSENLAVWIAQLKATLQPLGWTVDECDGAGNVTTMENCMESFVTHKVSAIVTMALGGPEIPVGFKQAAAANIPVMAEGTSVTPGYEKNYTGGIYADNIVQMGDATAAYIAAHLKSQPVVGEEITQNYGGQGYVNGVIAGLKANGLKYTDLRDTNLANIVPSMTQNAQAIIQKNAGPVTFLDFSDFGPSLFEPVFAKANRKNITLITRYDDPTTVKLMKSGDNVLVQVSQEWKHIFDMTTAMLNHFNNGAPFPPNSQTVNQPGATVVSLKQFPAGSSVAYPFDPALKAQLAEWAKTYKLQPSTLTAP
jgi:ABC-type sugar transport system substrate-binding protein